MKILVTGGCGFIGSYLVDKLIELGNEVVVLDNLLSGKKEKLNKKAKFVFGDVRIPEDIKKAMKGCEVCFHLAAVTDVRNVDDDLVYQTNFLASRDVFDVAEKFGTKIIFTSSAAVYGNSKVPNKEDDECKPVSKYGRYKLKAEGLAKNAFIVRLFNVYGHGGKGFINRLCNNIPKYEEIIIYGNGLQTRDYIYVTDVVDALLLGIENSGLYNVGTGVETSILQLLDIFNEITKIRPSTKFTMPIENEIKRSRADITKIKKLRWEPKISLEEGIKLLLNDMGVKLNVYKS